jgi:hypothetical protein
MCRARAVNFQSDKTFVEPHCLYSSLFSYGLLDWYNNTQSMWQALNTSAHAWCLPDKSTQKRKLLNYGREMTFQSWNVPQVPSPQSCWMDSKWPCVCLWPPLGARLLTELFSGVMKSEKGGFFSPPSTVAKIIRSCTFMKVTCKVTKQNTVYEITQCTFDSLLQQFP